MGDLPPEFKTQNISLLCSAARGFARACPAASALLRCQISDACETIASSQAVSARSRAWLQQLSSALPPDPAALVVSAQDFGKRRFQAVVRQFEVEARIDRELISELVNLATLLGLFEHPQCQDLATRCRAAAVKAEQTRRKAHEKAGQDPEVSPGGAGGAGSHV
jgi:hypothetical protein